jgi:Putative Flp pilus-assembly TadE/G-like
MPSLATCLLRSLKRAVDDFAHDRSGAAAVTIAITFTLMVGCAALGTEVAEWYSVRRTMQGAADSAAFSAALAKYNGANTSAYTSEGQSVAASYGFVDGTNNAVVTINSPPASGNHTSDSNAVEVTVSRPQPLQLARLFLSGQPTLTARAVATLNPNGSACVLALDHSDVTDVADNGNTTLNLNGCNLYVNSVSDSALTLKGQATINALAAYIDGNYTTSGQASLNTTQGTFTGAAQANDPYADVSIPSYSGCDQKNYSLTGGAQQTLTANSSGVTVLCNGLSLTGGSSLTLPAGIYVIDGGGVTVSGNSSISGNGVSIILTSSSGSNDGTVSIAGGSTVSLNETTPAPLAGIAVYQDRNAPQGATNSFTGGTTQNINGAIYFPNQSVTFNGGTNTGSANKCTQLIAQTITFNGNAAFNSTCSGFNVRSVGTSFVQLVE